MGFRLEQHHKLARVELSLLEDVVKRVAVTDVSRLRCVGSSFGIDRRLLGQLIIGRRLLRRGFLQHRFLDR